MEVYLMWVIREMESGSLCRPGRCYRTQRAWRNRKEKAVCLISTAPRRSTEIHNCFTHTHTFTVMTEPFLTCSLRRRRVKIAALLNTSLRWRFSLCLSLSVSHPSPVCPRLQQMVCPQSKISTQRQSHFGKWKHSLYLHAEELQQSREDAHVVEEEDVVSGPVEDVSFCVTLIKHTWIHTRKKKEKIRNYFLLKKRLF